MSTEITQQLSFLYQRQTELEREGLTIKTEIERLKTLEKNYHQANEKKEAEYLFHLFSHADTETKKTLYEERYAKLREKILSIPRLHDDYKITRGRKWDSFQLHIGIMSIHFKIDIMTGDSFCTGKYPKANIFRNTLEDFIQKSCR